MSDGDAQAANGRPAGKNVGILSDAVERLGHDSPRQSFYRSTVVQHDRKATRLVSIWHAAPKRPKPFDFPKDFDRDGVCTRVITEDYVTIRYTTPLTSSS